MLSMGEAAKQVGLSKATLSRAIKSGKLSAHRNDNGGFNIDPAELFRAYPANPRNGYINSDVKRHVTPLANDETPVLRVKLEAADREAALLREQARELREQRDAWQKQAEQAQRLLVTATPQPAKERKGLFTRIFG